MYRYNTIASDAGEVELVKMHSSIWIDFTKVMDKEYPTLTLVWDNEDFIFGKFYRFLKRWNNNQLKKKDKEEFEDIWDILTDDLVEEMLAMLDLAITEGWYERKTE